MVEPEQPLEVVIRTTEASVEGRVTDGTQAVSNTVVLLVPSPDLRRRSDLYYYAATDSSGHFRIQARVVPGDYKLFAWKDIEPGAWQDPDVLQRYENQGQPVSISADSKLNIDVRVIPEGTVSVNVTTPVVGPAFCPFETVTAYKALC